MNDPRLNFNWCVEQTQIIHCKRSKVWETISSESNLELFHPFCKKNNIFHELQLILFLIEIIALFVVKITIF